MSSINEKKTRTTRISGFAIDQVTTKVANVNTIVDRLSREVSRFRC
jgi:outer membrane murein-binding lipoprotein Lpp